MTAAIISVSDLIRMPLNKNIADGRIDSANALNMLLYLKQIIHIRQ